MVKVWNPCRLLPLLVAKLIAFTPLAQGYGIPPLPGEYEPNFPSDTNYTGFPGTNAVLAVYPLDGDGKDAGGRGLDGTLFGTTPAPDRFGRTNGALRFNGVSDYIDLGNRPEFNFTNGFALTAWIKVDPGARNSYVIGKYYSTGPISNESHSYGLGLDETLGAYGFVLGDGVSYIDAHGPGTLNDGQWHVTTLSYEDGFGFRLYADGQLAGVRQTGNLPPFENNYPLLIGKITTGWHFGGTIDDVTIHGRALSDSEIRKMHLYQRFYQSETPVLLKQATATFSQSESGDFSVARMVDGLTDDNLGWAIAQEIHDQTAVFETESDAGSAGGTVLKFNLLFNHHSFGGTSHTLGRFRLSATTDARDVFADGLQNNGDVSANWTPLAILSAASQKGATLTALTDSSILVSGTLEESDIYTVAAATRMTGITGIRLEALEDPSLPFNGPGREPINGNFVVSEMLVAARPGGGPVVTNAPISTKAVAGNTATFNVGVSSALPVTYQWLYNGAPLLGGTNSSLVIDNADFSHAGTYTVQIDNAEGSAISSGAVLNVLPQDTSSLATLAISNRQPSNAPISDIAGILLAGPRYLAQAYAGASAEALLPAGPAVPFLDDADAGYFIQMDLLLTNAPGDSTFVEVRVWDSTAGSSYEQAVQNGGQRRASPVLRSPTGGGGVPTPQLEGLTALSLVAPPKLLSEPSDKVLFVGQEARFEVQAWGSSPLTYQWFFDSNVVANATNAALVLTNVPVERAGHYYAVVTNLLGSVTSRVATLTVNIPDTTPPVIALTSPTAGETYDERVTLAGSITDNDRIVSATWERNGVFGGILQLDNGRFSVSDVPLIRGVNELRIIATDPSANAATNFVTVTNLASRAVFVGDVPSRQEGADVRVPLILSSRGDVGGLTFNLNFDRTFLADPEVEWSEGVQDALTQVNTNPGGGIRGSFALFGTTLPAGAVQFATVIFRSRSVPDTTIVPLPLSVSGLFGANGDAFSIAPTDVRAGSVQITRRKFTGDNNANDRLDISDASTILRLANFVEQPRFWDVRSNDLNANAQLDTGDVIRVLRAVVGLDPQPSQPVGILGNLALRQSAAGAAQMTLQIDKSNAAPGEQVRVTVHLNQFASELSGGSFKLQYPAAALKLANATAHRTGALVPAGAAILWNLSPAQNDYAAQDGVISLAVTTDRNWNSHQGVLAEFIFTVQGGATSQYRWSLALSNAELSSDYDLVSATGSEITFLGGAAAAPRFEGTATLTNGAFSLSLHAETGAHYRIEVSENLVDWTTMTTLTATETTLNFTDSVAGQKPRRFYRATQVD